MHNRRETQFNINFDIDDSAFVDPAPTVQQVAPTIQPVVETPVMPPMQPVQPVQYQKPQPRKQQPKPAPKPAPVESQKESIFNLKTIGGLAIGFIVGMVVSGGAGNVDMGAARQSSYIRY